MAINSRGLWIRACATWALAGCLFLAICLSPSESRIQNRRATEAKSEAAAPVVTVGIEHLAPPVVPQAVTVPPAIVPAQTSSAKTRSLTRPLRPTQSSTQEEPGGEFPPLSLEYGGLGFEEYLRRIAGLGGIFIVDATREQLVARVDVTTGVQTDIHDRDVVGLSLRRPRVIDDPRAATYLAEAQRRYGEGSFLLVFLAKRSLDERLVNGLTVALARVGHKPEDISRFLGSYAKENGRLVLTVSEAIDRQGNQLPLTVRFDLG